MDPSCVFVDQAFTVWVFFPSYLFSGALLWRRQCAACFIQRSEGIRQCWGMFWDCFLVHKFGQKLTAGSMLLCEIQWQWQMSSFSRLLWPMGHYIWCIFSAWTIGLCNVTAHSAKKNKCMKLCSSTWNYQTVYLHGKTFLMSSTTSLLVLALFRGHSSCLWREFSGSDFIWFCSCFKPAHMRFQWMQKFSVDHSGTIHRKQAADLILMSPLSSPVVVTMVFLCVVTDMIVRTSIVDPYLAEHVTCECVLVRLLLPDLAMVACDL